MIPFYTVLQGTRATFSLVSHFFSSSVSNKQLGDLYHTQHMCTRLEEIMHVSAPCASLLMTQGNDLKLKPQLDHASNAHFHQRPILDSNLGP